MTIQTTITTPKVVACQSTWDARLLEYRLARILYDADAAFGPFDAACRTFEEEKARIDREYASRERAKAAPDGAVRLERAWVRITAAETRNTGRHLEPLWEAARQLAYVPAPDFPAVKIKMEVIQLEELWNDGNMEQDAFELIAADVARLQNEAA
jgi:hypothetical protein